ncbi:MAG: T9SS type A sorting domain-containing protein [Bacteroidia bacterium]
MIEEETKNKEAIMNVSNLPNGIYFLQVKTVHGSSTQKIIVQH